MSTPDYRHTAMGYASAAILARQEADVWKSRKAIAAAGGGVLGAPECQSAAAALEAFAAKLKRLSLEFEALAARSTEPAA